MDGLIFSTEPIYFQCYQEIARPLGLEFTFELYERCIGISVEDAAPIMRQYFGRDVDAQALYDGCGARFEQYMQNHKIPFRPGAKEAIEYFHRRGLKLGLATSNIRRWVDMLLKQGEIAPYFSSVLTSDDVSKPKPKPEVYLRSAQALGADVAECLAFDDSVAGATAAISAGIRTCVVPDLKQPNSFVRANAFKIYSSLEDIYPDMDDLLA